MGRSGAGLLFTISSVRQHGADVIRVPLGSISLDLMAQMISYLRSSSLRVNTIVLKDPVLILKQNPQADWNLKQLINSSASSSPAQPSTLSLFVDHLQITNGHLDITPAGETTTQVTALSVAGAVGVQPAGMRIDLTTLSFGVARLGVPPLQWQGGITYDTTDPAGTTVIGAG